MCVSVAKTGSNIFRGLPFEIRVPKQKTLQAMQDARDGKGKQYTDINDMFEDLED